MCFGFYFKNNVSKSHLVKNPKSAPDLKETTKQKKIDFFLNPNFSYNHNFNLNSSYNHSFIQNMF